MNKDVENIRLHLSRMKIAKRMMRKHFAMGYAECVLLWILHEAKKPITGRQIQKQWLGGQLASTLTTLEKKGLIVRVLGDNAQKAKINSLSEKGAALSDEWFRNGDPKKTPTLKFLISILKESREKLSELDRRCRDTYSKGGAHSCNVAAALGEKSPLTLSQIATITSIDYALIFALTGNPYVQCINLQAAEAQRLYELTASGREVLDKLSRT